MELNKDQTAALKILNSSSNVFLTGQAGVGKTTLVREFLKGKNRSTFPVLASTGMAALIAGGRTVHSAFRIGVASGDHNVVVDKALVHNGISELCSWKGILIDEVSMLDDKVFNIIEEVARRVRGVDKPWGGLKVVVVGDFAQLPPVSDSYEKPWAFKSQAWLKSKFKIAMLNQVMRTNEPKFIDVLNLVRRGVVDKEVEGFLNSRIISDDSDFIGTRLFGRRSDVEDHNMERLDDLSGPLMIFKTKFWSDNHSNYFKILKNCPVGEVISLKVGALVMIRVNHPDGLYVNGSLGFVTSFNSGGGSRGGDSLSVKLMGSNIEVDIDEFKFEMRNSDDLVVATAKNFPVNLAYAMTIHKTQGATLDRVLINAGDFWEAGQCYVAFSRVRTIEGLNIKKWSKKSIIADKDVLGFYNNISEQGN